MYTISLQLCLDRTLDFQNPKQNELEKTLVSHKIFGLHHEKDARPQMSKKHFVIETVCLHQQPDTRI